ncbi:MAG: hypothetical protein ACRDZ1_14870 [Acidimicrobiia bacterium]
MRRPLLSGAVAASSAFVGVIPAGAGPASGAEEFCQAVADASILLNKAPDEDASKKKQEKFAANVERLVSQAEQSAPSELASQVSTSATALRELLETGEHPTEDPAAQAAFTAVHEYVFANCGYRAVDVTGLEYEFEGIPETLEAGITIFRFTNTGAEVHELELGRLKGDNSAEDVAEGSPDAAEENVKFVAHGVVPPGETRFVAAKLKAGDYAALCFIPVGTTDPETLEDEEEEHGGEDAEPHAAEGMFAGFTVEKSTSAASSNSVVGGPVG